MARLDEHKLLPAMHDAFTKRHTQADVVEAFNSTSRYLDDLLNIDHPYFAQMVSQIYPTELQLNKANPSPFLDLDLSITNGIG